MLADRKFGMQCIALFNACVSLATYWQGSTVFRGMVTRSDSKITDRFNLFQEPHRGLGDASGGRLLAPGIGLMALAGTRMGGACHPSSPPSGDRHGIPGGISRVLGCPGPSGTGIIRWRGVPKINFPNFVSNGSPGRAGGTEQAIASESVNLRSRQTNRPLYRRIAGLNEVDQPSLLKFLLRV